ncbi:starvation-inducible DNA-binding protein [Bifidobacterium bohemicum]|uniref:Ferritin-like protein n=1 Tax=Bifidobacterium bohemicum DSM 22767 TaxID=1437606 RepID=A0A086ZHA6_9BIFI|nr:DNA starvation/stationary phase protection protein [Bifidobacterium bohemicum]KFI45906.1 ferritin-like protein [Bifidobacterium bohemicum DSM 22767]SCC16844.1 starvation-inducible DNA-binding protein [Bifidobacterium bohemicum]
MATEFLNPGLDQATSDKIVSILQNRLAQEEEASLILKHAHWNVAGPSFIGVHEMLDPEVDAVRNMADETAERIATLGGSAQGTPESIIENRTWSRFTLMGRQNTQDYLKALIDYYADFITAERNAYKELDELDIISSNIMQDHVQELEHFNWFMNSHLICETPKA